MRLYEDGMDMVISTGRRMTSISSDVQPPRMPGDGSCGCRRERLAGKWILHLCERHGQEPGIMEYCLPL